MKIKYIKFIAIIISSTLLICSHISCNRKTTLTKKELNYTYYITISDSTFITWYYENKYDTILFYRNKQLTENQQAIVALSFIEIDSLESAKLFLPELFEDGLYLPEIPSDYSFYKKLACYRLAEKEIPNTDIIFSYIKDVRDESFAEVYYDLAEIEFLYFKLFKDFVYDENDFHNFYHHIDFMKEHYSLYHRVDFLYSTSQFFNEEYTISIPILTKLFHSNYNTKITGAMLYDYYFLEKNNDSIVYYMKYKIPNTRSM